MKHAWVGLIALVATASAETPKKAPRLWTDAEVKTMKASLAKRLGASKSCPRAPLHDAATKGSATKDLQALFEGADACSKKIDKLSDRTKHSEPVVERVTKNDPEIEDYEAQCGAKLEAAVEKAVAHESACSPWELGARDMPTDLSRTLSVAHLIGRHAKSIATKDPVAGVRFALDGVRLYDDLARGKTDAITHVLSIGAGGALVRVARDLIDANGGKMAALIPSVDALLEEQATTRDILAYEGDAMAKWTTTRKKPARKPMDAPEELDPKDEAALMLALGEAITANVSERCKTSDYFAACKKQLAGSAGRTAATDTVNKMLSELALKTTDDARRTTRSTVVAILRDLAFSGYVDMPDGGAFAIYQLAGLRMQLEASQAGACPATKGLETDPWKHLRTPRQLGEPLAVSITGRTATVALPTWLTTLKVAFTFTCPAK